jgi:hypothetical protein
MVIDIYYPLKRQKELISVVVFGLSILLMVVMLWRIQNFLKVSLWARVVVNNAVQQIDDPTPDTAQYLSMDKALATTLNQNNVFIPQAVPVNPISEVRAIFGDSALINGNWYKAGASVGEAKILSIDTTKVLAEFNGEIKTFLPVEAAIQQTQQVQRGTPRGSAAQTQPSGTAIATGTSQGSSTIGASATTASGGARIDSTTSGRASRFGFQQGDIVLSINGQRVSSGEALTEVINNIPQGSAISAIVLRNDQQVTVGREALTNVGGGRGG